MRIDQNTAFSRFLHKFSKEYIAHSCRFFAGVRSDNQYQKLISVRPKFRDDIAKMILLDFITRQDDRHLSNTAIKVSGGVKFFYPLYDNGRSLFYEDTEEMVRASVSNPMLSRTVSNPGEWGHQVTRRIRHENHFSGCGRCVE